MRRILPILVAAIAATSAVCVHAQTPPDGFYRYPSIGAGWIVFASEGDLWKIPVAGGVATRLTAYEGEEKFPRISPDGKWIAYTAQYEGNDDVYVMPATGGEPRRLTFHPAPEQALGWTADGKILFRSRRDHPHGDFHCYTIPPTGGIAQMIALEPAAWVSYEPGGSRIAVQKIGLEFHNWKRYRGGEAEQLYIGTLAPLSFQKITTWEGKNAFPMWATNGRVYFVTDRWGRPNLASMNPDGSDVQRHTKFDDFDVRWPYMGDGRIVYQHKMDLWMYDLATGQNAQVAVQLPSDRLQVMDRFVNPMDNLTSWSLSRDGERIALETRGTLFVTRTKKKGLIRQITDDSSARSKSPAFSPDGKSIAAWTEVKGEEQLMLYSADLSAPARQIGSQPPGWRYGASWSPNGKSLAWGDQTYKLRVMDVATGRVSVADSAEFEITSYAWSPDSRYIAFTGALVNEYSQVRVWDSTTGRVYPISDQMFDSFSPAWDPQGKFLYFLSARRVNPYVDRAETRFIVDKATVPCVVALTTDGDLPFAPLSDVDTKKADTDAGAGAKGDKTDNTKKGDKKSDAVAPVKIDFDGIASRVVEVPVEPGNYGALYAVEGKLHWFRWTNDGMFPPEGAGDDDQQGGDLLTYDIEKQKLSTLASGVRAFDVSGDAKVLVYQTGDGFTRVDAGATEAPQGDGAKDAKVELAGWSLRINPRQEWKQQLHEAWRIQRDFFYDRNMHGVDWNGVWASYGPLADRIASRDDLGDMLGEMFGELSVGHAYWWGGDVRRGKPVGTGLLGADMAYDDASGFWQIRKIYRGDYPTMQFAAPLARADLRVKEGMWLVAIDGKPLTRGEDYLQRLASRAGQNVELSVNTTASLTGARRVIVKTVGNDTPIRYASWIRDTRAYVDSVSGGQIGYLHLYDMGGMGLMQFARDYPPQWRKRGFIIDDRWNHGGWVAQMILAHLDRKILSVGGTVRYGSRQLSTSPDRAYNGYLSCLINRQGGSDCETLAQGFKDFKLGPVIGTRTWGGWVGIRGDKRLRDGGTITEPEFGGWDPKGKYWMIEGHGVDPDVELDLNADGLIHRNDLQLDYAIKDLLEKIKKDPRDLPPAPPIEPRPLVSTTN